MARARIAALKSSAIGATRATTSAAVKSRPEFSRVARAC